jgi:LAS superfamily LD-carboxypeptidase LdcB
VINSGFRSDAEQARPFTANPDPQMVAPPGKSLHRCGTELDLGPAGAYGWVAADARRFGFLQRYSWSPGIDSKTGRTEALCPEER